MSTSWQKQQQQWAWLLIAPVVLGLGLFTYLPTLGSLFISFCQWDMLLKPSWVGISNYTSLFFEPQTLQVAFNTLVFTGVTTFLEVGLALVLALALFEQTGKTRWLQALYGLPYLTPMLAVALWAAWWWDADRGGLNTLLNLFPLLQQAPVAWLYQPGWAMAALITLEVWKSLGYNLLLLITGLKSTPEEVLEAARLDGATGWRQGWFVVLPMLSPTLFLVVLVTLIHTLQSFDGVYLLTQGGPQGATRTLGYWVYQQAFDWYRLGPASALAFGLTLLVAGLTVAQWQLRKRWVLYED